ncbi:MAG: hypothetical protein KGK07_08520 [Chloroflexota bacterium]|nr:hypothetical protein [Chloroflexota bacterium]
MAVLALAIAGTAACSGGSSKHAPTATSSVGTPLGAGAVPTATPSAGIPPFTLTPPAKYGGISPMSVASSAFADGGGIPREYTCDGRDISPPLS